jgi:hypothetical protein
MDLGDKEKLFLLLIELSFIMHLGGCSSRGCPLNYAEVAQNVLMNGVLYNCKWLFQKRRICSWFVIKAMFLLILRFQILSVSSEKRKYVHPYHDPDSAVALAIRLFLYQNVSPS